MITYQLSFMIYIIKYHLAVWEKFHRGSKIECQESEKLLSIRWCSQAFYVWASPQTWEMLGDLKKEVRLALIH